MIRPIFGKGQVVAKLHRSGGLQKSLRRLRHVRGAGLRDLARNPHMVDWRHGARLVLWWRVEMQARQGTQGRFFSGRCCIYLLKLKFLRGVNCHEHSGMRAGFPSTDPHDPNGD
ncbi:hypothetical protein GQ55_5G048400 [Panicum hallii var. hallii]|uniref:Uncharacterized protein n=1 Tax=Panicum hallii var. hallii TaxID=1504633 RepID=A0A2T7DCS4_9POAL|nr:hypothetical protein GQ55_5G048400 [Panicum hallii var. hallii]